MVPMKRNPNNRRDRSPSPWRTSTSDKPDRRHRVKCEVIGSLLLDYLNRELDPVRSDMVWKHLKKCADCEREAKEMESTLALLRKASRSLSGVPDHLSEKHRASIVRALTHPILHAMETYHVMASLVVAVIIIAGIVVYLRWSERHAERVQKPRAGVDVSIIYPPPPDSATNEDRTIEQGIDNIP